MKRRMGLIAGIIISAVVLVIAGYLLFCRGYAPWLKERIGGRKGIFLSESSSTEPSEEWFTDTVSEENFDFSINDNWIYLNDLEYSTSDKLKSYLFMI